MHYIVLGGGTSYEKEVSQRSAASVQKALEDLGHTVAYLDPATTPTPEIIAQAKQSAGVLPILHGAGGEDGTIQAELERENIPYFGPSAQSCRGTFDKARFKEILEQYELPTPKWNVITADDLDHEPLAREPFVLKPTSGGSSIDTFIIRDQTFDSAPLQKALAKHGKMLIEELIDGPEITVGILEDTALPVIEIIPPHDEEFDYENKYNGAAQELCPPVNVSTELQEQAQQLALEAHRTTQCRHLSRTDIMIDKDGNLFIIDTNTIPGLTDQSLFPKAAEKAGYSWAPLVDKFTKLIE